MLGKAVGDSLGLPYEGVPRSRLLHAQTHLLASSTRRHSVCYLRQVKKRPILKRAAIWPNCAWAERHCRRWPSERPTAPHAEMKENQPRHLKCGREPIGWLPLLFAPAEHSLGDLNVSAKRWRSSFSSSITLSIPFPVDIAWR
jgi:hypothetical protein